MRPKCSRSGKDVRLVRQVRAAAIDQINARQAVLARDFLCAEMLLHGHRVIGAALDRRIVADDHDLAAFDPTDACDHARAVDVALIHAVCGERTDFEERRAEIKKLHDTVARQQLASCRMPFTGARRAAFRRLQAMRLQLGPQGTPMPGIGSGIGGGRIERGFENGHGEYLEASRTSDRRCVISRKTEIAGSSPAMPSLRRPHHAG